MQLILLHGAPASGKLTLAKELSKQTGFAILHNHLSVDLALAVYRKFGDGDFFNFVDDLRARCIEQACLNRLKGIILTWCFDSNTDKPVFERWCDLLVRYDGQMIPIHLDVTLAELKRRVLLESRRGTNKIQSVAALEAALAEGDFSAIAHPNSLLLKESKPSLKYNLTLIIKHLRALCCQLPAV
jgi:AAA domain